jgi:hypothetical protein
MDGRYTPPGIAERTVAGCAFVPNSADTGDRQTEKLDDHLYAP